MADFMLYKDLTVEAVRDVDKSTGTVTGYFSVFNNQDSDNDIILPGAFSKTLKENGPESPKPRILHLFMHDPTQVLGKPTMLKEDKKGLYFETVISKTALGKDVIQLYLDKVLSEHSIGYQIVKREVNDPDGSFETRVQKLIELKLWEGSTVSWGANMEAVVESVKDENKVNFLFAKLDAISTALKGNYTDETARQLEILHNQIKQLIISLSRPKPVASTTEEKPKSEVTADWIISKINLKIN